MSMNPGGNVTKKISKVPYRDSLHTWPEIVRWFSRVDPNDKKSLEVIGSIIYLVRDDDANAMLHTPEAESRLNLNGLSSRDEADQDGM